MSRIGKKPILIPNDVTVTVTDSLVTVKGKLGEMSQNCKNIKIKVKENELVLTRKSESKEDKSFHGLYRSLIYNMIAGVSEGFEKELELVGVGYRAQASNQILDLSLGYSHNILFRFPSEVKIETISEKGKNPIIKIKSFDKQLVGQVAAKIRSYRKPEPYKGKGIKFVGEQLRRKAGKSA